MSRKAERVLRRVQFMLTTDSVRVSDLRKRIVEAVKEELRELSPAVTGVRVSIGELQKEKVDNG